MCFMTPEGVVLGADSTSSMFFDQTGFHYFNHNQKLFEVGENSTLGIVTWGMCALKETSYRTLIALLADDLAATPALSVQDAATSWANLLWNSYSSAMATELASHAALNAKTQYVAGAAPATTMRTEDEENHFTTLTNSLYVGFCIAGYVLPDRKPKAYQLDFLPTLTAAPVPKEVQGVAWWGAPNFILRLMNGWDNGLRDSLMNSGKWSGNQNELEAVLNQSALSMGPTTLRDAIDFAYSSIHSTIKALKFSSLNQICGGPIEIAVISTDRLFRWVRHKKWDTAITEGDIT
jgi:hypothetical protein